MMDRFLLKSEENGNVLFLILIAVALFGALSYAVTRTTQGSGSGVDKEKQKLEVAEMQQQVSQIKFAIMRMQAQGIDPREISFSPSASDIEALKDAMGGP